MRPQRREDAWQFLHGTPAIPSLYGARPGLEIIHKVGIEAIRSKSRRQTQRLIDLADERGYRVAAHRDPERRAGTVALDVPHGAEVSRALKARAILCDYRPGAGVRLSPHFYNRDDELEEAVAAIGEIIERGSWKEFGARTTVT